MIADIIIRILGDDPAQFSDNDKWPVILADLTDLIVPYGQIILFILPFIVIKIWKKPFTFRNLGLALLIGILLAYSAGVFDNWLLRWAQGQAYYDLYGR